MGQVAAPLKLKTLNDSPYIRFQDLIFKLRCKGTAVPFTPQSLKWRLFRAIPAISSLFVGNGRNFLYLRETLILRPDEYRMDSDADSYRADVPARNRP